MFEGRCTEVRMEEWGEERKLGGFFKGVECKWGKMGLWENKKRSHFLLPMSLHAKQFFSKSRWYFA